MRVKLGVLAVAGIAVMAAPVAAVVRDGDGERNRLRGTSGADFLIGRGDSDVLRGRGGADRLRGGAGRDKVFVDRVEDGVFHCEKVIEARSHEGRTTTAIGSPPAARPPA